MSDSALETVSERLPDAYFPYSFLKSMPKDTRRRLWVRRLPAPDASRDIVQCSDTRIARLAFLPWDSTFFKRTMYRLDFLWTSTLDERYSAVRDLESEAGNQRAHYLLAVVPCEDTMTLEALGRAGWSVIETRATYWRGDLDDFNPSRRSALRVATTADIPGLGDVAAAARNPFDRFRGDPFFTSEQIDALMREWVRASISNRFADAVLVPDQTTPQAFMTLKYLKEEWDEAGQSVSQLVLSAVHPRAPGWYPKLVSESVLHVREKGAEVVVLTTQTANRAVIRSWENCGFAFGNTHLVLRKVL